jgi:hypothetical protein
VAVNIPLAQLMPHLTKIGTYLKLGADHYADLRAAGSDVSPEIIAAFLQMKMADWDPRIYGKALLDDETRAAAARFLAGLAVNFSKA